MNENIYDKLADLDPKLQAVMDAKVTLRELASLPPGLVTNLGKLDRAIARVIR